MVREIYIDGACSGNPGPMRIALFDATTKFLKTRNRNGEGTNNIAEYQALILALTYLKHAAKDEQYVSVKSDSQLVVYQFNGYWKCKNATLRRYLDRALQLAEEIPQLLTLEWIPREQNLAGHLLEKMKAIGEGEQVR